METYTDPSYVSAPPQQRGGVLLNIEMIQMKFTCNIQLRHSYALNPNIPDSNQKNGEMNTARNAKMTQVSR